MTEIDKSFMTQWITEKFIELVMMTMPKEMEGMKYDSAVTAALTMKFMGGKINCLLIQSKIMGKDYEYFYNEVGGIVYDFVKGVPLDYYVYHIRDYDNLDEFIFQNLSTMQEMVYEKYVNIVKLKLFDKIFE